MILIKFVPKVERHTVKVLLTKRKLDYSNFRFCLLEIQYEITVFSGQTDGMYEIANSGSVLSSLA